MRIIVGLVVACFWLTAQTVDARPAAHRPAPAKHAASTKKPKARAHAKQAAKTEAAKPEAAKAEEPAPEPQPKAPARETRVERAPVTQIVDSEEPEVRKRK